MFEDSLMEVQRCITSQAPSSCEPDEEPQKKTELRLFEENPASPPLPGNESNVTDRIAWSPTQSRSGFQGANQTWTGGGSMNNARAANKNTSEGKFNGGFIHDLLPFSLS